LEEVDFQADETAPGSLIATRGQSDSQPLIQGGLTARGDWSDRQLLFQGGLTANPTTIEKFESK
jgi:hypothetical protein